MTDALLPTLSLLPRFSANVALRFAPSAGAIEASAAFEMQSTMTSLALEDIQKKIQDFSVLMPRRFFEAMALRNNETFAPAAARKSGGMVLFNLEQPVHQMALSSLRKRQAFLPRR
jgi:hypothetical protein